MIQEAIDKIEQLSKQTMDLILLQEVEGTYDGQSVLYTAEINATENGRQLGKTITPYRPATLNVTTLTGFLDAIKAGVAGPEIKARIIHVSDYLTVSVKTITSDKYGVRDTLLIAKHTPLDAFTFDKYYTDPAKFIIGLQVAFLQTEELLFLIKLASSLKTGKSLHVQDDGYSQAITLKTGEVTTVDVPIKPRIKLVPIRTFPEANPVESEFLIRFQQTAEETPAVALFNVDGTRWQGDTMRAIKDYLAKSLPAGTAILA